MFNLTPAQKAISICILHAILVFIGYIGIAPLILFPAIAKIPYTIYISVIAIGQIYNKGACILTLKEKDYWRQAGITPYPHSWTAHYLKIPQPLVLPINIGVVAFTGLSWIIL